MSKYVSARSAWGAALLGAVAISTQTSARAALLDKGVTYTLFETVLSPTEDRFTLEITGMNVAGVDTEGGRYGVGSIAFTLPSHFGSAAMSGFSFVMGGLNSSGCNMNGNFYCFLNDNPPSAGPVLASGSKLDFSFDLTVTQANALNTYNPMFKIDWLGTKNNYDLVSQTLTPTLSAVPLPAAMPLLVGGIAALGFLRRRKTV